MTKGHQPYSRRALFALAAMIGIFFPLGEAFIFAAALNRHVNLSEPGPIVLVMNAVFVAIPFLLLAKRSSTRVLPWLLAFVVTGLLRWWYLSMGIEYQRASDGSGVPMLEALIMLVSPLPISLLALATDNVLQRQANDL